jgi:transcriptional regulator with XRE-family HTH domain
MLTNVTAFPADRYLRAARHQADLSQRELAAKAGLPQSTVARIERTPSQAKVDDVAILLGAMGLRVVVVDHDGVEFTPEAEADAGLTDRAGRRFPAHLDVRPGTEGWWGSGWPMFEGKTPAYTFDRARHSRDWRRTWSLRGTAD